MCVLSLLFQHEIVTSYSLYGNEPSDNVEPKLVREGLSGEMERTRSQQKTHVCCYVVAANFNEKMEKGRTIHGNYP